ncbi:hypothetical protein [Streptomyces sp. NPDC004376]
MAAQLGESVVRARDLTEVLVGTLDVFAEAAGLDRERTRRWAQLHAVQAAFAGRRRGFRRARKGPELNRLLTIVDELAMT